MPVVTVTTVTTVQVTMPVRVGDLISALEQIEQPDWQITDITRVSDQREGTHVTVTARPAPASIRGRQ